MWFFLCRFSTVPCTRVTQSACLQNAHIHISIYKNSHKHTKTHAHTHTHKHINNMLAPPISLLSFALRSVSAVEMEPFVDLMVSSILLFTKRRIVSFAASFLGYVTWYHLSILKDKSPCLWLLLRSVPWSQTHTKEWQPRLCSFQVLFYLCYVRLTQVITKRSTRLILNDEGTVLVW